MQTAKFPLISILFAAIAALAEDGYTVVSANPLGGSFVANSEVSKSGFWVRYTFAHVVVEPSPQAGMRIRLALTRAISEMRNGEVKDDTETVNGAG